MIYRYNSQRYCGQKMSYILKLDDWMNNLSTQALRLKYSQYFDQTMRPEKGWIRLEKLKKLK